MKIRQTTRTPDVLQEVGQRVEQVRLQQNTRLEQLAKEAGIGIATLQRLETGENVNLQTLVKVLRSLNRLGDLDNIIPDLEVSPFEIRKQGDTPRRRASRSSG